MVQLVLASSFVAFVLTVSSPVKKRDRGGRGGIRSCFAIQKTLAGAYEMYDLDCNRRTPVNAETCLQLVASGYLQSFPIDPGADPAPFPWIQVPHGNGLLCLRHGAIQPPGDNMASARDQLIVMGVTDPALLARASTHHINDIAAFDRGITGRVPDTAWLLLGSGLFGLGFAAAIGGCGYVAARLREGFPQRPPPWTPRPRQPSPLELSAFELPVTFVMGTEGARCPVCAEGYDHHHAPPRACSRCRTLHHDDCLTYAGKCAIYGCRGR